MCCWSSPPIPRITPRAEKSSLRSRTASAPKFAPTIPPPWKRAWASPRRKPGSSATALAASKCPTTPRGRRADRFSRARRQARRPPLRRQPAPAHRVPRNVLSSAEQRAARNREHLAVARIVRRLRGIPAMTGKFELEYEGELRGARQHRARTDPRRRRQSFHQAISTTPIFNPSCNGSRWAAN